MPLAGFTASQGQLNLGLVLLVGVVGTILGALPWYYLGYTLKADRLSRLFDRYGKWLGISGKDVVRSQLWFQKYGPKAVLFGRMVPGVRTLISLPAGIAAMPMGQFLTYSTIGVAIWVGLLTFLGFTLGEQYHLVEQFLAPISKIVVIIVVVVVISFLGWRWWQNRQNAKP